MNVLDGAGHTWGNWYWPVWLIIVTATFLGPEIYSLITDHGPNTLSAWVWKTLQITSDESPLQWSAADALSFGVYLVIVVWLAFHFWFGRLT